ncbi:glutathione S-transferase family protein [Crocosphaera sp. XPORK-15E]|uniref:glutathione S-transferase family protein n=1 Tax=Crocosphaera sp. XPORK-15E TaxID=3110247 RepID=UPI002B207DFE|nr:glutathione S-transferase family protein [Crocosphaera sp. XPORK-15E]MEA5535022.1 glutathione S-transferase family protein [Crocosphaera sp. XPORK-15E]
MPKDKTMLKLHHLPISFNSRRVWIALLEKGLDFESIPMKLDGDQLTPEFLALNPFHHIPVLVDENFSIFESLAILDYLEAKYPTPSLIPSDPQGLGTVKMINLVTINELLPATRPLIRQSMGFATIETAEKKQAEEKSAIVLNFLENLIGDRPYIVGDTLSLGDIVAGTMVGFLQNIDVSLTSYPKLSTWIEHLSQRESWQQTEPQPEQIAEFRETIKQFMAQRSSK